ncbi:MAG TPA: discoidin domain-containing protein, partial [Nitrososphaeraceae archaeon]|nr:discoidin domain-containing protein [Nitrososphaeraceae archaeon]
MKIKALNHRSYNAIVATSLLSGILLVGLVENIYQEAKAQSLNYNLPKVTGLGGLERGKIQIEKIINSVLTGVTSTVQKTRLPILNEPPILSDAKREIIQKAEERTHLYGPPLPRSNQPIFGPLYQTQVRLAVANQTGNSDIGSYPSQTTNNQRTSNLLANNDTSSNNSSRCQSLPIYAITNSGHYGINVAINTLDRNYDTYWSNLGRGSWIQADLGEEKVLCSLDIAWYRGNLRHNNFEVSVSNDSSTFRTVLADESSGTTRYFERYVLPQIAVARYVKIIINGNSENSWASITEINLNGYSIGGSSSSPSLESQEALSHSQNSISPIGLQIYANKL